MIIGQKLKEARARAGLSQEAVSEEIHVSRQTVSNWETEKTYPDVVSLVKLSDLYGVSLDELLKGDSDMLRHLEESTNTVKSQRRLSITTSLIAAVIVAVFLFGNDLGSALGWIELAGVFILLCAADFAYAGYVKRPLQIASRILIILCIIVYLGIIALCALVAVDAFQSGDAATGAKLLGTAVLVAVCIYVLFIRRLIRKLKEQRENGTSGDIRECQIRSAA